MDSANISKTSNTFFSSQTLVNSVREPEKEEIGPRAEKSKQKPQIDETRKMADALNELMGDMGTNLGFYISEDLGKKVIVEIKNRKTDEVIRQIPSEELLNIMKKMEELSGLIFDQRI